MSTFDQCEYSIVSTSTIHILLASSVPCIALSHLEIWCKLRRCIQTLGMISSVILNLIISFLKTSTIPTYQGISIAFPRYIAMQHTSSHDLIFSHTCFSLIEERHASWALPLSLLHDALVSLHILLHWQRHTFAYIMIVFQFSLC